MVRKSPRSFAVANPALPASLRFLSGTRLTPPLRLADNFLVASTKDLKLHVITEDTVNNY